MFNFIRKWLCTHNTVEVRRMHSDVVPNNLKGKELYVDRLGVVNFVCCTRCGSVFNVHQREKLFEQQEG